MKKDYKEIKNPYNFWERIFSRPKRDIDFVFEQNPELKSIGTKEQYQEYLKTIFPGRKVSNIVYHQTPKKFEKFDTNKSRTGGIYFSPFNLRNRYFVKAALLNIKNPFIISKKQNKQFERYLPNLSKLYKKADLREYDGVIGFSNVSYDKGQLDSEIINVDTRLMNNIEFVAFNPKQIHLLGSKPDIKGFKKYLENKHLHKKQVSKKNSLEGKLISGIFILSFLAGLFFLSSNLTGYAIGTSEESHNLFGIFLTLLGVSGYFIHRRLLQ